MAGHSSSIEPQERHLKDRQPLIYRELCMHAGVALQRNVLPDLFEPLAANTALHTLRLTALSLIDAPASRAQAPP